MKRTKPGFILCKIGNFVGIPGYIKSPTRQDRTAAERQMSLKASCSRQRLLQSRSLCCIGKCYAISNTAKRHFVPLMRSFGKLYMSLACVSVRVPHTFAWKVLPDITGQVKNPAESGSHKIHIPITPYP